MPMYYPDLKSVQDCVCAMRHNREPKQYNGIYPETEAQLQQARQELANYFRVVWKDEIQALEVELAVSEDDYDEKMASAVKGQLFVAMMGIGRRSL